MHGKSIQAIAVLSVVLGGCEASLRQPARGATLGALDAFENPPQDAELAGKIGKLANRYLDQAIAAGPSPSVEDLSASATRGALKGLGQTATQFGPTLEGVLSGSLRAAANTLAEQSSAIGRVAGRAGHEAARGLVRGFGRDAEALALLEDAAFGAGRAVTSGATDELVRRTNDWVGPDGQGPLADAMATIASRSAEYAVTGALAAIRKDLQTCVPGRGELCLPDMTRLLSRSAGRGASEGVAREFDWLTASIAFVTGLVAAIGAGAALNAVRARRRMRA